MKKMKGFRALMALLTAAMMVFGSIGVLAEENVPDQEPETAVEAEAASAEENGETNSGEIYESKAEEWLEVVASPISTLIESDQETKMLVQAELVTADALSCDDPKTMVTVKAEETEITVDVFSVINRDETTQETLARLETTGEQAKASLTIGEVHGIGGLEVTNRGGEAEAEIGLMDVAGKGVVIDNADGSVTGGTGRMFATDEGYDIKNEDGTVEIGSGAIKAFGTGVSVKNDAKDKEADEVTVTVAVGDHITVLGKTEDVDGNGERNSATGFDLSGDGTTTAIMKGKMNVQADDLAYGVAADAEGDTTFIMEGDTMHVAGGNATGIWAAAGEDGSFSAMLTGNMDISGGYATGIRIGSDPEDATDTVNEGTVQIAMEGNINVRGTEDATGIRVINEGETEALIAGNITSTGDGIALADRTVEWDGGKPEEDEYEKMTVNEDELFSVWTDEAGTEHRTYAHSDGNKRIEYDKDGNVEYVMEKTEGKASETRVEVIGDVTAGETGIKIDLQNSKSKMDVLVDGIVQGEAQSVLLSRNTVSDNLVLTVWEIKENERGNLVERESYTEDIRDENGDVKTEQHTSADRETEKKIQYIIRIEPSQTGIISTEGTRKYQAAAGEYNVASEGETVTLKLNVPAGYQVVNAYNGTDTKVELAKDAAGNYYLIVPRGGAVMLSVDLQQIPGTSWKGVKNKAESEKKASVAEAADTKETQAIRKMFEDAAAEDILTLLPKEILDQLPEGFGKLIAMKTLKLVDYDESAGTMSFALPFGEKFREGEEAAVALACPEGKDTLWFYAKGTGQADGTLLVTLEAETLKQLREKAFVALAIGK